jgi:hypothetical protein
VRGGDDSTPSDKLHGVAPHDGIIFEIVQGPTIEDVGQKMIDSIVENGEKGYRVQSVSHACDPAPADVELRWSVLISLERVENV